MKIRFNPNLYEITASSVCFKMIWNNFHKNFFVFSRHKILGSGLWRRDEEKLNLNQYLYRLCTLSIKTDSFHSKEQTRLKSGYTLWSLTIRLLTSRYWGKISHFNRFSSPLKWFCACVEPRKAISICIWKEGLQYYEILKSLHKELYLVHDHLWTEIGFWFICKIQSYFHFFIFFLFCRNINTNIFLILQTPGFDGGNFFKIHRFKRYKVHIYKIFQ